MSRTPRTDAVFTGPCNLPESRRARAWARELEVELSAVTKQRDELRTELFEIAKIFNLDDTIGGESTLDYVARKVAELRDSK